ncbi:carboxylesterase family protein [Streptomyces abikoensis]|uniref:carboxylesterase/lipase family protein n=1 Tax=Streptomyces abikoensis TaxID=97398 RepID=UPI0033D9A8D7
MSDVTGVTGVTGPTGSTGLSRPEVRTDRGTVRGRTEDGLAVFRGIPYAQPPVGELRFMAPRPARPWDGVRDAAEFGPPPPQSGPIPATGTATGDDWLTLNVWSPDPGGSGLPVLMWILGGGYVSGHAGDPLYDAGLLARQGGLVVVTVNYRVGAEASAQLEGAPANRGLLDLIAALEWVQGNIAGFGGDPARVTVAGQSSGAGSIATLLAVPRAAGLFRRATAQSVPGLYTTPALASALAAELAGSLGTTPTVAGLATIDPWRLAEAITPMMYGLPAEADRWGPLARTGSPFSVVVDGDLVPETPWTALPDGRASGVDLLTGHTRDEFRPFLVMSGGRDKVTDEDTTAALNAFAPGPDGPRAYRAAYPDATPVELFETVHSDVLFRMPSLHLAEAHTAGGGTAHLYELRRPAPVLGGALGAAHGLDVSLLFGTYDAPQARLLLGEGPVPEDLLAVGEEIRRSWTAFATHGDPGWPAHQAADGRLTRLLDTEPSTAPYPEEPSRKVWEGRTVHPYDLPA